MAYFRDKFKSIFKVKDSPHRVALAFAVGVFMGISPFLGLHYIGAFLLAWFFRLNKLVALVGVSVNNPWTIVPITSFCVWIGAKLIGMNQVLPHVEWKHVTLPKIATKMADPENFLYIIKQLLPLIKAFFVGSFVICTVSAVVSFFIIHILASRYQKI